MPIASLDRMAVDDVATGPERIAAEIHRQLGDIPAPILVHQIARALDIVDIHERRLIGFEGMLITDAERDFGVVCVNSTSSVQRRRYSLAHELCHFLSPHHKQTTNDGFRCTRDDMVLASSSDIHSRQESEANRFAIELLAPPRLVSRYLRKLPELEHVLSMHTDLEISKAAAARRYVALHPKPLAVVFAQHGSFQYVDRGAEFPYVTLKRGKALPPLPIVEAGMTTSEMIEAEPERWLGPNRTGDLSVQVLQQDNGRAIILLHLA